MALDEMLIEELGIGPVWVRRGAAALTPGEDERPPVAQVTEAGTPVAVRQEPTPAEPPSQPIEAPTRAIRHEAKPGDQPESDGPPLDAYDDLPWTDEAPVHVEPAVAEAPSDVHTLDWDALAERVANCERCRLCERRTNTVFGVGDREADWMLIGEAPGENEDKQGEPFVGQAGKLLDNMLRALTLSRQSNVYIANVIKCRPPGNRNPELDEVARCEPYLQRQVELVKPKVIVAMGRFAAQSLLKNEASISSMRSRVHEYRGVPVIVTYHPAYLLRSLQDKSKAWADLCLARKTYREALAALGVEQGAEKGGI
jgi:DNA polymerase